MQDLKQSIEIAQNTHGDLAYLAELTEQYQQLDTDYQYLGIDSCAATGLCEMQCPVGINTGEYIKALRQDDFAQSSFKQQLSKVSARHFATVGKMASLGLTAVSKVASFIGEKPINKGFKGLNKLTAGFVPLHFSSWPKGEKSLKTGHFPASNLNNLATNKVIYFPACAGRIFAPTTSGESKSLAQTVISVLNKAGFEVVIPNQSASLCCGMAFSSKGDNQVGEDKLQQAQNVFRAHSQNGQYPIITDASSCAIALKQGEHGLNIYESAEFVSEFILPHLQIKAKKPQLMLHVTCSSKRDNVDQQLINIARHCAEKVIIPADISCCGFAGDKGFYQPELNQHALRHLKHQRPQDCDAGYSNNRSCEIGLTEHSGMPYQSILYLLDQISIAKA